jgi:ribosomal protein S18 acetylase RimI-like enzyme
MRALRECPEAFTSSWEEESRKPVDFAAQRLGNANAAFWGAWDTSTLAGMVGLERESRAKSRHKATVVGMYVPPEHARAGIGRRLVEALVAHAVNEGIEILVLTVTEGNERATALYERAGFRSFGIEPKAIKVDGHFFGKNHMVMDLTQRT